MTREEAKEEILDYMKSDCYLDAPSNEACEIAVKALSPVRRELVENVWMGEWLFPIFADQKDANDTRCQCSECGSIETPLARHRFCPSCGAPMTDEAVQIVMKRLEALKDGSTSD